MNSSAVSKYSNYSRHLSSPNNGFDSRQVYGPSSNHVSTKFKTGYGSDILPSKDVRWESKKTSTTGSSFHSSRYQQQSRPSRLSYNSNARKVSPPRESYLYDTSSNSSYNMVRPPMRDRNSRPIKSSFTPINSSKPSLSPSNGSHRPREGSLSRSRRSPSVNRRTSSSNDLFTSTGSSTPDKSLGMPPRNSTITAHKTTSFSSKPKQEISIEDPPYKNTTYRPSFVNARSSRTPSPKQSLEASVKALKIDGNGTTGLKNIGNTCFMNSILQCLSNTKHLRDYCLRNGYVKELNPSSFMKGRLMKAFSELIADLWSGSSPSVTPTNFKAQIQKFSPRFMGYEQQDSQEFLRFLLEGLHEDINRVHKKSTEPLKDMTNRSPREIARETWAWYGGKDDSFIFDLFVGQLESRLECSKCGHVSMTYDPFWDLSLPISKNSSSISSTKLEDCIRNFTKEEVLDRDEKPMCEKCGVRRKMKKKLSIHRFPKILVIHLKRFNEGSRYRQKLSNLVSFPVHDKLKLTDYSTETSGEKSLSNYKLYAVSNHCGSCYGGHYTAYCRNPHLEEWYQYNDSRVSSINASSVCTKEAYVLFYAQTANPGGKVSRL